MYTCNECKATIHHTNTKAHNEWHDRNNVRISDMVDNTHRLMERLTLACEQRDKALEQNYELKETADFYKTKMGEELQEKRQLRRKLADDKLEIALLRKKLNKMPYKLYRKCKL